MNEAHVPEDEFENGLDWVDGAVEDANKSIKERDEPDYDGILGTPPPWVPEWAVVYFEGYRDRLLSDRGFEVSVLLKLIEQYRKEYYREEHTDIVSVPYFRCPETYPNGQYVDEYCFLDEIGFLSHLKWCVDQGEEKCLEILGGGFAVSGLKRSIQLDKQHNNQSEAFSVKLDSERADWVTEAKSLLSVDRKDIYRGTGECPVSRCASEKIARNLLKKYNYADLGKASDRIRKYFKKYPATLEK